MANSVITLFRRIKLCKLMSEQVTHVAFGSGGVDETGEPMPPLPTQITLQHQVAVYPIIGVEYTLEFPTTVRYTVEIPAEDLPGVEINEAALVDGDGNFHAIKTFYSQRKIPDAALIFSFDDEF